MGTYHTVEQGEYLSSIAKKYGFASHETLWDHPQNSELKKKRKNPNVLFPGDRLFIPTREIKNESRSTEQKHRFQARKEKLILRLVLEELYDRPLANAKCELHVDGQIFNLTADGTGKIEQEIPSDAQGGVLIVREVETPIKGVPITIKIGDMDPVDEHSGQVGRLRNLGYYRGRIDQPEAKEFLSAVEEFQCEHGLTVDGVCGAKTQAKLKQVHGC